MRFGKNQTECQSSQKGKCQNQLHLSSNGGQQLTVLHWKVWSAFESIMFQFNLKVKTQITQIDVATETSASLGMCGPS